MNKKIALAASLLLLAGCSVKAPPRTSWSLSGGEVDKASPSFDAAGPALGLARFTATSEARSTSLTWRDADGHLLHETSESWADYPDRMLEDLAMQRLLRSGSFRSVTAAPPRDGLDAVLSCRLVQFGEWDSGGAMETRVGLRWELSGIDGAILGSGEALGTSRIPEKSMASIVKSYSTASDQALSSLIQQVTARLRKP